MSSLPGMPTGAVMVVGGGIAGMQASLDLADQGFKVYLVESSSAIGGKMAQLDKTFPTNDCAMCTISPRLVETARHPNIQIITNAEVLDVSGQAGSFTAHVRAHARYVDLTRCVSCGDCVKVCPVVVPDRFNAGLSPRRAIYKLYPQAVPNGYAIDKRGIAPCRDACPAGQRAQGYIALIREGRWQDAMRVIKMDNPFPGICGRICNHRCESACNRGLVDEPVNIRALKRFVTDKVYSEPRQPVERLPVYHRDRPVAIIGAGPCGLTAAQDILRAGFPVTVFEAMPVAGGMLRLGVPEYRLPSEIVDREVQDIVDLGIDLRLGARVDNLDDLFDEGYFAVLIAVGAHEGIRLRIPGAELGGVMVNTHFLRDVRLGAFNHENGLGRRVLILGGGNVAIDCARTALRLGQPGQPVEVHLACLESRAQMPAHPWEIESAEAEGVILHPGLSFERILSDENGRASGVECMEVASFSFDENKRLHVEKTPGSMHVLACDTVIFSVGQRAGLAFIPADTGVGITDLQTIAINPNTMAATRSGVFAAGDSVSGTGFVIEAVASGHQAAESILRYLHEQALETPPKPELPVVRLSRDEIEERVQRGELKRQSRLPLPELPLHLRSGNFMEVEGGYDDENAQAEAARCLACGVCSECMSCVFACGPQAINHDMLPRELKLPVGAVVLAPGYQPYQAELSEEFGLGRYPNVVTNLQFERLLSASGPTKGHVQRPSDGDTPHRIAFLQCIGSRDQNHDYCSAVCCMAAVKEAIIAKEHHPELEIQVFFMDLRAFSKGYSAYFERARQRYGIRFTHCRVSDVHEDPHTHHLNLAYYEEDHQMVPAGKVNRLPVQECFDMVVLSAGMEISESVRELGRRLAIDLDPYGFCGGDVGASNQFNPLETSRPGIYSAGPFREPKDIPESVVEASGAAAAAASRLATARFSLTTAPEFPPELDVRDQEPRLGVFVCHCGSNIGGFLDVPEVTRYAASLTGVVHAENNLYTCSQDSIRHITDQIQVLGLNRVVVASCTPLTHQPLFQDSLKAAGLNPFLFEMANIRNHCSWVHSKDPVAATEKAKDLVRMAAARAALLQPQNILRAPVQKAALVVGGGAAGMSAALSVADQGFPVHLVERQADLGGNLRQVFFGSNGRNPQDELQRLTSEVRMHRMITVHLESQVVRARGFMGSFTTTIVTAGGSEVDIQHGAAILATGGEEYRGSVYGYGVHRRVLTQQELEGKLQSLEPGLLDRPARVVMIQCAANGSLDWPEGEPCSRICCTVALKNALAVKSRNPQAEVVILHQDIRVYGFKERLYQKARQAGVIFLRYEPTRRPEVQFEHPEASLQVLAWDTALNRLVALRPDWLVLSMPVTPSQGSRELASIYKLALDGEGFFQEAHVKLRPVDFATEGVFMAGMAHFPCLLDEALIQGQAAAARAARLLSQDSLPAGGIVASVTPELCTGCLTCVRICPYHVPTIDPALPGAGDVLGAARIEAAICQGCGLCAAECPARAIQLLHYTDLQMSAKIGAALPVLLPMESIEIMSS